MRHDANLRANIAAIQACAEIITQTLNTPTPATVRDLPVYAASMEIAAATVRDTLRNIRN